MNIVIAAHHFPPTHTSGGELIAYRTARWLIDHGHTVRVVCVESIQDQLNNLRVTQDEYDGIPVQRLHFNLDQSPESLQRQFDHPQIESFFARELSAQQPDLLYLISGYLIGIAPLRAAQNLGIPTAVLLTDFWFLCPTLQLVRGDGSLCNGPEPLECARCAYDYHRRFRLIDQAAPRVMQNFWTMASQHSSISKPFNLSPRLETLAGRKKLLREILSSVDAVIAPTKFVMQMHIANGVTPKRAEYVDYSVTIPETANAAPRSDDTLRLGYLGQIVPIKGVDLLVRAFKRLDRSKRCAKLSINGNLNANPRYTRELRRLAANDPDIIFAGAYSREQLSNVLNNLDVIVVPSTWYENSPIVILEAFAAGKPVIGTNVGGIAQVIQDESNGLLFERNNVSDLTRQLQRTLDEPGLLARLSQNIPPRRTLDQEMTELVQLFDQLVAAREKAIA